MDYLELLNKFGWPTALLIVLLYLLLRLAKWMGPNLVIPLRDAHLGMVSHIEKTQTQLAASQQQLAQTLESQAVTLARITDLHADNTDDLRRLRKSMGKEED